MIESIQDQTLAATQRYVAVQNKTGDADPSRHLPSSKLKTNHISANALKVIRSGCSYSSAGKYMLISMPQVSSSNFGVVQAMGNSLSLQSRYYASIGL